MVGADGDLASIAVEGLARDEFPPTNLVVAVGKTAAREADSQVRMPAQRPAQAEFRVEVSGRDRQSQRQVRPEKIRDVAIIKRIGGERRVSLKRCVVADLNQFSRNGIDLAQRDKRDEAAGQNQ